MNKEYTFDEKCDILSQLDNFAIKYVTTTSNFVFEFRDVELQLGNEKKSYSKFYSKNPEKIIHKIFDIFTNNNNTPIRFKNYVKDTLFRFNGDHFAVKYKPFDYDYVNSKGNNFYFEN